MYLGWGVFLQQTAEQVNDHLTIRQAICRVGILPDKRYRETMSFLEDDEQENEINLTAMFNENHRGNVALVPENNVLIGVKFKLAKRLNTAIRFDKWWTGGKDWN